MSKSEIHMPEWILLLSQRLLSVKVFSVQRLLANMREDAHATRSSIALPMTLWSMRHAKRAAKTDTTL